ncbi:MAG: Trm112 family protein [candidate division Zixibacteria bacterium]|nr:Trm112 family protein [candidate division Zixibacteria bacterium]
MALPKKLVQKLACPKCQSELSYPEADNRLECDRCRLAYRIDSNIPVLLLDEAEKMD